MLDQPWRLGARVAPSHVLFGPHCTNLGDGRAFSERHAAYYARRAQGGCGVVVTETISVHESDWPYERAPLASALGRTLATVAARVHEHDALLVASLGHTGMQGSTAYSQGVQWAPSLVPHVVTHEQPLVMEAAEIATLRRATVEAAAIAIAAGCDGVELNVGQFSLFRQFLSGLTNLRTDEWGERTALVAAVLADLRTRLGGAVLGARIVADELAPWAGITPEIAATIWPVVTAGLDYVVVERGSIYSEAATRPDMREGTAINRALCAQVRPLTAPGVAVVAQGSIVDVDEAADLLRSGVCDGVEMTRAQIADPDLVARAAGRLAGAPRPCTLCNQGCLVRDVRNPLVSCAVNPVAGHELDEPDVVADGSLASRSVTVRGAGPAGLATARGAALRGASVTLVDRQARIGGALHDAALLPGRDRWDRLTAWFAEELVRLGVDVRLESDADAADVVATGRTVAGLELRDGSDGSVPVLSALDALRGDAPTGTVAVLDPVGAAVGVGVAELLAAAGTTVTLVTPDVVAGVQLSLTGDLVAANARLASAGVTVATHAVAVATERGAVVLEDRFSGAVRALAVDAIVHAGFDLPGNAPADAVVVGDALAPRTVNAAILEGHRAALALRVTS